MLPAGDIRKRRIRRVAAILIAPALLGFSGLMFGCPLFLPFLSYESLGAWKTVDLDGNECVVEVLSKNLSLTVPPGELPRIKLVYSGGGVSDSIVHDTGWRFGAGLVRAVPGGIELFQCPHYQNGFRFQIRKGKWFLAKSGLVAATSDWEERLDHALLPGMTREEVESVLRSRIRDLNGWELWPLGYLYTLDREAVLEAQFGADGRLLSARCAPTAEYFSVGHQ